MERRQIVENIARERMVETIVRRITRTQSADTDDLVGMVYETLLTYKANCIVDLWNGGREQMEAFIARIVCNQWFSVNSPFYYTFGIYRTRVISLDGGRRWFDEETDARTGRIVPPNRE